MAYYVNNKGWYLASFQEHSALAPETQTWLEEHAICYQCKAPFTPDEHCQKCGHELGLLIKKQDQDNLFSFLKKETRRIHSKNMREERDRRKRLTPGFHTEEDIKHLFDLQKGACAYCALPLKDKNGKNVFELDHVVPLSSGGSEWIDNILLSCKKCNQKKWKKSANEFWNKLKKEKGEGFIKEQRSFIRSLKKPINEILKSRKAEYEATYSIAPCVSWMDEIIQKHMKGRNPPTTKEDIRDKFLYLTKEVPMVALSRAKKKERIKINKRLGLTVLIYRLLALHAFHDVFEGYYGHIKDFQNRFDFEELIDDINGAAFIFNARADELQDLAYDEYDKYEHKELFNACIDSLDVFLKTNSELELNNLSDLFIRLNNVYAEFIFPK